MVDALDVERHDGPERHREAKGVEERKDADDDIIRGEVNDLIN